MTEQELIRNETEAIDCLKKNKPTSGYYMLQESVDMAIKALEEIQQYRALGTVEELRVARDKQVDKKVVFVHPLQLDDGGDYMCPSCKTGTVYDAYGQQSNYCSYCGQKLDWSDEDDNH